MQKFKNVTLEMSLKPFTDSTPETMERVCRTVFTQWLALTRETEMVSVMLWAADGSEILDYRGSLEDAFEWAKWIGVANPQHPVDPRNPACRSIHHQPRLYIENPPEFTYAWLKELVCCLKRIGTEITGLPVRVGATFDPGPEFAKSSFKYERHRETCLGNTMGKATMVCCYSRLHADNTVYAGYPDGIPEGTPFGEFLGRQAKAFTEDLGFDYLWLSNGFGFGMETWGLRGAVFDGREFSADRCPEVREKSMVFWNSFRVECPDLPLETRGTNLSTGMDLASDAVPLQEIYETVPGLRPPPNSPWAALNSDFGLELIGWMSHVAEIPEDRFPFRFYTHDPWFLNSPWLDRYQRQPHDIYLPMSVSRIDAAGQVQTPTDLEFLTIDDSYGRLPDQVPNEVTAHILAAREWAPDAPAPLVWVYPFEEYHGMTFRAPYRIEEVFFGDWFMRGAVNNGLPLNTVISTGNFTAIAGTGQNIFAESVLVSPVPDAGSEWARALIAHVKTGGKALVYGPLEHADPGFLELLNLKQVPALDGKFALELAQPFDLFEGDAPVPVLRHHALFSAGGLDGAVADSADSATRVLARAIQNGEVRTVSLYRAADAWGWGGIAWVRGTVSCDPERTSGHLLVPLSPDQAFPAECLMRDALRVLGWDFTVERSSMHIPVPMTCVSRHLNAFIFAGFSANTTAAVHLRTPQGIPLLTDTETRIIGGRGRYAFPKAWQHECRVFIEQSDTLSVGCRVRHSGLTGIRRRLEIVGLEQATVRFFHEPGTAGSVEMRLNSQVPCLVGELAEFEEKRDALGSYLEARGITGQMMISW